VQLAARHFAAIQRIEDARTKLAYWLEPAVGLCAEADAP